MCIRSRSIAFAAALFAGVSSAGAQATSADSAQTLMRRAQQVLAEGTVESGAQSIRYRAEAARLFKSISDTTGEATALLYVGFVYNSLAQFDSARAYFAPARALFRAAGAHPSEVTALFSLGRAYRAHRPDSALAHLKEALTLTRLHRVAWWEASILLEIGETDLGLGRLDSALVYARAALAVAVQNGDARSEISALRQLGDAHDGRWAGDSALAYYRRALTRARDNALVESEIMIDIARVYRGMDRRDSSQLYLERALLRAPPEGRMLALLNMAHHYADVSPDSALFYYTRTLPLMGADWGRALVLNGIAEAYYKLSKPDSALAYFGQALRLHRQLYDPQGTSTTLRNIARAHRYRGDSHVAVVYYDSAAVAWSSFIGTAGGDENRILAAERDPWLHGEWAEALLTRPDVNAGQSMFAALAVAERGRAQSLLAFLRRGASPSLATTATSREVSPSDALVSEGFRLAGAAMSSASTVLEYLVTPTGVVVWVIKPAPWRTPGSALVNVFFQRMSADSVAMLVAAFRAGLGADSAAVRSGLGIRDVSALETVRGFDFAHAGIGADSSAVLLAGLLLPPGVRELLPFDGEIVIVPHGPVNLVPFAALAADSNRVPLGIRYGIRYAPSLAALGEIARAPPRSASEAVRQPLIVGDPAMPELVSATGRTRLRPLAGARAEGRAVAGSMGARLLTDVEATEGTVRQLLPKATLVHLATHGFAYSASALARRSFVALAPDTRHDGLLTVSEILDELPEMVAELVVLSACQTGLGDVKHAEGTVGLQRAFLAKGARSVIVSLWSVSDEATALLMRGFYRHWLSGKPKGEALRAAQAELRGAPGSRFHHPRFWAAFQLVGAD